MRHAKRRKEHCNREQQLRVPQSLLFRPARLRLRQRMRISIRLPYQQLIRMRQRVKLLPLRQYHVNRLPEAICRRPRCLQLRRTTYRLKWTKWQRSYYRYELHGRARHAIHVQSRCHRQQVRRRRRLRLTKLKDDRQGRHKHRLRCARRPLRHQRQLMLPSS